MISVVVDASVRGRLNATQLGRVRARVGRMVRAAGLAEGGEVELEASLLLTNDEAIQVFNRDYRGKDKPTDVLAFAQREGEAGALQPWMLGDVVISLDTAKRQAKRGLYREVLFLAAHGLCHLLGYDHQTDEEEAEMNARMKALLREAERKGRTRAA